MMVSNSSSNGAERACFGYFSADLTHRYLPGNFYAAFFAASAVEGIACPFTVLLNGLVIAAVITRRRLQSHPNILLACLAATDLMVGLSVQPLDITIKILLLQGKTFNEFCETVLTFTIVFIICGASSTFHLVLIISERYFAIKHTFAHESIVTKARLLIVSALVWILTIPSIIFPEKFVTFTMMGIAVSSIIVFQVLVYREARRHEQQILSHQVSEEARAKFKKEMKALKLTTIIIVVLAVSTFPTLIFTIVVFSLGENFPVNNKSAVRHLSNMPIILSSLLNPVVYTVRKEEFRIACIELLLRKSYQEATEISRRLFGPSKNAVGAEEREEGEGWERDAEERNSSQAYDSPESDPEVLAPSAYLSGNNTAAPQSLNGTEVQLQIIQEGEKRTENAEERNPRQAIDGYEGNPEDLAPSGNLAGNSTAATQSLYCREEQTETLQHGEEGKGNSQERNPPQANYGHEDDPETLVPSSNLAGNNTSSPQSLKGIKERPETIREDEERKESAKERNGRHVNDGHEDVSEALLSSSCLTGNTDTPSLRSVNGTVEQPEITRGDEERKENAKERSRHQVNDDQEDLPEALLVSVHLTDNTTFPQNKIILKTTQRPRGTTTDNTKRQKAGSECQGEKSTPSEPQARQLP